MFILMVLFSEPSVRPMPAILCVRLNVRRMRFSAIMIAVENSYDCLAL